MYSSSLKLLNFLQTLILFDLLLIRSPYDRDAQSKGHAHLTVRQVLVQESQVLVQIREVYNVCMRYGITPNTMTTLPAVLLSYSWLKNIL